MRYHDILHEDTLNGSGIRVVLFVSGCENKCKGCQNPQTWDFNSGSLFGAAAIEEMCTELEKSYVSGTTLSGGDPMHKRNLLDIANLCKVLKDEYPLKTIWCYTGYLYEELLNNYRFSENIAERDSYYKLLFGTLPLIDVLVDGKYDKDLDDINYPYAGSTNQRVIDVKKSLTVHLPVLWTY